MRAEPVFLTAEQVLGLARAPGDDEQSILTLAFTGLRFGELAALKVKRFDAARRRLQVAESCTEVSGKVVWSTPKTHQTRSVPVPGPLGGRIADLVHAKGPEDLIFTAPSTGVLRLGNWRARVFEPACRAVGLDGVSPHDLRHTAASLAIRAGANAKAVQRMLGHASAARTLYVYAGLFGDDLAAVGDAMASLLAVDPL